MSISGDAQNVNINHGNLVITDSVMKVRTPTLQFNDNSIMTTAPGLDQVTSFGSTTANSITVGNVTATGHFIGDGSLLTGVTSSDTLNTVVNRGNSTSNSITIGGLTVNGGIQSTILESNGIVYVGTGNILSTNVSSLSFDPVTHIMHVDQSGGLDARVVTSGLFTQTTAKGQVVYLEQNVGGVRHFHLADNDGANTYPAAGLALSDYATNDNGYVVTNGLLYDLNIPSTFVEGSLTGGSNGDVGKIVYLSATPGFMTITRPSLASNSVQTLGVIAQVTGNHVDILVRCLGRVEDNPNGIVAQTANIWGTVSIGDGPLQTSTNLHVTGNVYLAGVPNGSNTLTVNGNASANYFYGNASKLVSVTDAAPGTYGSGVAIPSITVSSNGRVTSVISVPFNQVATGTTNQVGYYSSSNTISGSSGLTFDAGSSSLTLGGSLNVGGDLTISGTTYSSNNVVLNDTIILVSNNSSNATTRGILMQRPAGNVMMAYLSSEAGGAYNNTLVLGYTFGNANGPLLTPDTSNALNVFTTGSVTANGGFYGKILGSNTVAASAFYGPINGSNVVTGSTISGTHYGSVLGSNTVAASAFYGPINGSNAVSASSVTIGNSGSVAFGTAGSITGNPDASLGNITTNANYLVLNGNTATTGTGAFDVSLGYSTGAYNQGDYGVAIGFKAGLAIQGETSVAIGNGAGQSTQGARSIAIGRLAGTTSQGSNAIAIGASSAGTSQGSNAIAIGLNAGSASQSTNAIAIGINAGSTTGQGSNAVAIGSFTGQNNQGNYSVALGDLAGQISQGANTIAIGITAGQTNQQTNGIAIGQYAGQTAQQAFGTAIGYTAGQTSQQQYAISIGFGAGVTTQGYRSIAIGSSAGNTSQSSNALAIGIGAGQSNQSSNAIALGFGAGQNTQGSNAIAIGLNAGSVAGQGSNAVALGIFAGYSNQGNSTISIGDLAGVNSQNNFSVAIGLQAGQSAQYANSTAVGPYAGQVAQGTSSVAIGNQAGQSNQDIQAVAIGNVAGQTSQQRYATAVGNSAGTSAQKSFATALGHNAGNSNQNIFSVAVGASAGSVSQGSYAVAIGSQAASNTQAAYAIAIGANAGATYQSSNSIVINATGVDMSPSSTGFFVAPIRLNTASAANVMIYRTTTATAGNPNYEVNYSQWFQDAGGHFNLGGLNMNGTAHVTPNVTNTSNVGSSTLRYVTVYATNGSINTSDENFKNFKPLPYGLKDIQKIDTIQFSWKPETGMDTTQQYYGVKAQQISNILPEILYDFKDGTPLMINYCEIIPVCINAIKELATREFSGSGTLTDSNLQEVTVPQASHFTNPIIHVTPIYNGIVRALGVGPWNPSTTSFTVYGRPGDFYWTLKDGATS